MENDLLEDREKMEG